MKIAIIVNKQKDHNLEKTRQTVELFSSRAEILMDIEFEGKIQGVSFVERENLFYESDLVVVLGGDGTLLSAARMGAHFGKPILGINLGHLGFLTSLELRDIKDEAERILTGDYDIDSRMMLSATVMRQGEKAQELRALNDIVVTRGPFSHLVDIKAYMNESFLSEFPADGLVVSTPTGSTAYALSAGGPVIDPSMDAIAAVPICPHVLNARPMVLPASGELRLEIEYGEKGGATITADGQEGFVLENGDEILISACDYRVKLVKLKKMSFYELLKFKLAGEKGEMRYEK